VLTLAVFNFNGGLRVYLLCARDPRL